MRPEVFKVSDKIIRLSLYALVLFIPVSKAGIEISFAFAVSAFLVKKIINPDFKFLESGEALFLLLFLAFNMFSLFNSGEYLLKSVRAVISKWLEYILIYIMFKDTFPKRKGILKILIILMSVSSIIGFDGVFQKLTGRDLLRGNMLIKISDSGVNLYGVSASFNHYNDFGIYLVMLLSLLLSYIVFSESFRSTFQAAVGLWILLTLCLLLTLSRGAWLSLLFVIFMILFLSKRRRLILFTIAAGFIILIIIQPGLRERVVFTFRNNGDANRVLMWNSTLQIIKDNPWLGKGVGTFMDYFHKYVPYLNVQYAHNCYLQMWAEAGLFTLISFLAFIGVVMYNGVRNFFINKDYLSLGLIGAIVGFLVHSFFDTHFYSLQLSSLFWAFLGLLANFKQENNPR